MFRFIFKLLASFTSAIALITGVLLWFDNRASKKAIIEEDEFSEEEEEY